MCVDTLSRNSTTLLTAVLLLWIMRNNPVQGHRRY